MLIENKSFTIIEAHLVIYTEGMQISEERYVTTYATSMLIRDLEGTEATYMCRHDVRVNLPFAFIIQDLSFPVLHTPSMLRANFMCDL